MVLAVFCRLWRAVAVCASRPKRAHESQEAIAGTESVEIGDDLTVIRGIGKATEERLHAAGITSFAELAECTPEVLRRALGGSRQPSNVEQWIRRARDLSSARQT